MKSKIFIISVVFAICADVCSGGVTGSGTQPIGSSGRSGLVRSPNPIDTSGNQLITGNVTGGKSFQGIVPYRATSAFGGVLPSQSLDNFIRDSAGSDMFHQSPGTYRPYYSQSSTVSKFVSGTKQIIQPQIQDLPLTGERTIPDFEKPKIPEVYTPIIPPSPIYQAIRPLEGQPSDISAILKREGLQTTDTQGRQLTEAQRTKELEQFNKELELLTERLTKLKEGKVTEEVPESKVTESPLPPEPKLLQGLIPKEKPIKPEEKKADVYEQMKAKIEEIKEQLEKGKGKPEGNEPETKKEEISPERQAIEKELTEGKSPAKPAKGQALEEENLSRMEMANKAQTILGKYDSFASFSKDRFNYYIRAGEKYMKEGKYYRAADVYTLATVYKPKDPLGYAGKSFALFGAGEYMSSALFLSRAIEIFPDYSKVKVDLAAMMGDKDKIESRLADVKKWEEKSSSGELEFLLGYLYYQLDRTEDAKAVIRAASEKMPDSVAVKALKEAIEKQ